MDRTKSCTWRFHAGYISSEPSKKVGGARRDFGKLIVVVGAVGAAGADDMIGGSGGGAGGGAGGSGGYGNGGGSTLEGVGI